MCTPIHQRTGLAGMLFDTVLCVHTCAILQSARFNSYNFLVPPHGAGTHSIEGKKWQENAEHIAQDIWGCSAFMLSKWDSYCRVDLGSPSQNFFRAPPARSAGKPMEHSYRYRLRFGGPIWLPKLPSIFPRDFKNFQAFFHRFFVR